jgi:hypothetical protein
MVGDVFLIALSPRATAPAIVITVNKTFKGGMRPFGQLPIIDVETLGLQCFKYSVRDSRWVHDVYRLLRVPQCLLYKVHEDCFVHKDALTGRITMTLDSRLEGLRAGYENIMPEYWLAITRTEKKDRAFTE